ncbi:MAG: GDSL-like Lipase/Acylhydrolase family [Microvirga sp.]|jgi:lysophospholipase L1-like esterase|nr:GDSL-like Lipase/Acylhydrolase family [Microvirga sp.]
MLKQTLLAATGALFLSWSSAFSTEGAAFGDSFTARSGSWYDKLNLGAGNFAVSGAVACSSLTALEGRRLAKQIRNWSAAGKPVGQAIIVFIGINDARLTGSFSCSKSSYRSALTNLRAAAVAAGSKLILCTIPDLGRMPVYAGTAKAATMTTRSKAWNSFIKNTAPDYGAVVVDLFSVLANPALISSDGLHPNSAGQQVLADAIAAKL